MKWIEEAKSRWTDMNARIDERQAAVQRAAERGIETGLPPSEALEQAVEHMTQRGGALENRTHNTVTFTRYQGADVTTGILLMFVFILPGILYLALGGKTVRLSIAVYPQEEGSRLVIGGDDWPMIRTAEQWAISLPSSGEWESGPLAQEPMYVEPQPRVPSLSEKLGELAESKDAGLITQEEYETKKKDLLDRM